MANILKSTHNMKTVVYRIQQMEQYFDEVEDALRTCPNAMQEDASVQEKIQKLSGYMQSGMWLHDYECDERGEIPADLKRGVLSEDGLYHLLEQIDTLKKLASNKLT